MPPQPHGLRLKSLCRATASNAHIVATLRGLLLDNSRRYSLSRRVSVRRLAVLVRSGGGAACRVSRLSSIAAGGLWRIPRRQGAGHKCLSFASDLCYTACGTVGLPGHIPLPASPHHRRSGLFYCSPALFSPPACVATHSRNPSTETSVRPPTLKAGKSRLWRSAYTVGRETPSAAAVSATDNVTLSIVSISLHPPCVQQVPQLLSECDYAARLAVRGGVFEKRYCRSCRKPPLFPTISGHSLQPRA